jgi:transposase
MDTVKDDNWWKLQEPSFHSQVPFLGRLIVTFRKLWNSVSARWYVLSLLQQQNEINRRLLEEIQLLKEEIQLLKEEIQLLKGEINTAFEALSTLDEDLMDAHRIEVKGLYRLQQDVARLEEQLEKTSSGAEDKA